MVVKQHWIGFFKIILIKKIIWAERMSVKVKIVRYSSTNTKQIRVSTSI